MKSLVPIEAPTARRKMLVAILRRDAHDQLVAESHST